MAVTKRNVAQVVQKLDPEQKRQLAKLVGSYRVFRMTYFDDPAAFVRDCFKWEARESGPTSYQEEIMMDVAHNKRFSVRSPHGAGKTALASWLILWFALTRDVDHDWKIPTTASVWRQLSKFLWPEVHKWARRLNWGKVGRPPFDDRTEFHDMSLRLKTGEGFALASDQPTAIEGAHAECILYIFDEAKAIKDETFDAAEGALSTGDARALAISTPGEPIGRFYDIHKRGAAYKDWKVRKVSKDELIKAGRMERPWAEARKLQWGRDSAMYQNRVEGEFAASDEDSIIALSWIERSNERWNIRNDAGQWEGQTRIGADIGRGGDPSVIARRIGAAIRSLEEMNEHDLMPVVGRIKGILDGDKDTTAVIDVIGIGAGVVDRLREFKAISGRVLGFNSGEHTDFRDRSRELGFVNKRAASWWDVRELLQNDEVDLPPDDTLTGELTAPKYKLMSGGRIQIESKDDIKKRIGRSTNYADAVIMAFWRETGGPRPDELALYEEGELDESKLPADLVAYMRESGLEVKQRGE